MDRRSFIHWLAGASVVAGSSLLLPQALKSYFFLRDNPSFLQKFVHAMWCTPAAPQLTDNEANRLLNEITQRYIQPVVADMVFQPDLLFLRMASKRRNLPLCDKLAA